MSRKLSFNQEMALRKAIQSPFRTIEHTPGTSLATLNSLENMGYLIQKDNHIEWEPTRAAYEWFGLDYWYTRWCQAVDFLDIQEKSLQRVETNAGGYHDFNDLMAAQKRVADARHEVEVAEANANQ